MEKSRGFLSRSLFIRLMVAIRRSLLPRRVCGGEFDVRLLDLAIQQEQYWGVEARRNGEKQEFLSRSLFIRLISYQCGCAVKIDVWLLDLAIQQERFWDSGRGGSLT